MRFTTQCAVAIYLLEAVLIHGLILKKADLKIDDYIDKLLTSRKFEQLVEKIADKAVEKLLNQQPNLRISQSNESEKELIYIENKSGVNISHETDVHIEKTPFNLKNLSLKFKHFTKTHLNEGKFRENGEVKKKIRLNMTQPISNINDFKPDADYIHNSDFENKQQEKIKQPYHKERNVDKDLNHKKRWAVDETKDEEDPISIENRKNEVIVENESDSMDLEDSKPEERISEFDNNVEKDKSLFDNESKTEMKSKEWEKNRKKRFRKEGNRIYTFMSSSDYDEYHEELDRIEKKRKVYI